MKHPRALVISDNTRARIRRALEKAAAKPATLAAVQAAAFPEQGKDHLTLADRIQQQQTPVEKLVEHVIIPMGYRVAISFEQQPPGLCKHLSISVDRPGLLPSPEAVKMIAAEYGIEFPGAAIVARWIEEFDPGHDAINLLALVTPQEGRA